MAALDNGFGTEESRRRESIALIAANSGRMRDYDDPELSPKYQQTYFLGMAFGPNGNHLYASLASLTDPLGRVGGDLGNGILVYRFHDDWLTPVRFLPISPQLLAPGRRSLDTRDIPTGYGNPYPAGLAVYRATKGTRILVADNFSDNVLLLDAANGHLIHRFDLSDARVVPAAYPYGVIVSPNGRTGYCSLWNASRVAELDLGHGRVRRMIRLLVPSSPTAPGSHPTAMLLSPDGKTLYVALSNLCRVAVIRTADGSLRGWLDTRLPRQQYGGGIPDALAQTPDGNILFVANAGTDSVAVFHVPSSSNFHSAIHAAGFIPTEWYPTALAVINGHLFIAAGKGEGTGPNGIVPARRRPDPGIWCCTYGHPYIASLIHGSIARVSISWLLSRLPALTSQALASNQFHGRLPHLLFPGGRSPIRHVIYIIKENRTYDQVFGDLGVGNGDPSLVLFGSAITPNEHALARQFGVLDNFYDSGEVSGNGHVWSTAATDTDYTEKTWEIEYRNGQHTSDYFGVVANGYPLFERIPDVDEPATGSLWSDAARSGITYRDYGEFVSTQWCDQRTPSIHPLVGAPTLASRRCTRPWIYKGDRLPRNLGDPPGSPSPWPWRVPTIARDVPTRLALVGHFDPRYAGFRLDYPDQLRADEFLDEFHRFVSNRQAHHGPSLPELIIVRLPNDHTMGTRPVGPSPEAMVADNDLAVGRIVQAVSHSPYWSDTAIIILEDDSQDGADHVDAHRSLCLVISKYSPGSAKHPFVAHDFYTTVNAVRTIEVLLGMPPMTENDSRAAPLVPLFSGSGDQPPFTADYRNLKNGLVYRMNTWRSPDAAISAHLDWRHADANPAPVLNSILWRERKGEIPQPAPRFTILGLGR